MAQMYQRSPEAIFSEVGGDIVALNVARGACYGMEQVTASIWQLLAEPVTLEQLCARLVEMYEVDPATCRGDVEALLGELEAEGMVQRMAGTEA